MAEQTLLAIEGELEGPEVEQVPSQPVVDWRQMRHFELDVGLLPATADILFYDPTAWEQYRLQILLAAAVVLAQSGTIAALVVQGRRKRATEAEVTARRLELAHLSRVTQLGELSGAGAHELNQPVTAILANAEAGSQLLRRPTSTRSGRSSTTSPTTTGALRRRSRNFGS